MNIIKKTWVVGMLMLPLVFFITNGFSFGSIDGGPFYGLSLVLVGFPLSGFAVDFYSAVVFDILFRILVPEYEAFFYFYQANVQWFVYWVFAFVSGYFQWFIALPWVVRKLKFVFR